MMVEAEATDRRVEPDRRRRDRADRGGRRRRPRGRQAVHHDAVRGAVRAGRGGRQADRASSRVFLDYQDDVLAAVAAAVATELADGADDRRQAGARGRARPDQGRSPTSSSRPQFEGREKEISARVPLADQEARAPARPARQGPHRRPRPRRDIRTALRRGRRAAAGARLGAVRARRDPDPGRHHAEHAAHGADARHARPRRSASATCTTTTSRRTRPVRPAGSARRSAARSATARSPSGRCCPVLPTREEFPYAIRQVSEALGSNGSTSMGSVCASTMSLLNAGVPLKAPVAGIAMGLISDEVDGKTEYVTLTDILGAEDAFGDMDFKVAGTREFVTALQLDTKLDGIPASVLAAALQQAKEARLHILDVMTEAIDAPDEMSPLRAAGHHGQDPGRQDRRGHRPQGQDDQRDPGRDRRRDHHRGRRHDLHRRDRRPVGRGGPRRRSTRSPTRRCRRSASATSAPSSRRPPSARSSRCCPAGRPAAHLQAAQAGRRQAGRQRRGRRQRRRQGPGRDRRDRRARQAVAWSRSIDAEAAPAAAPATPTSRAPRGVGRRRLAEPSVPGSTRTLDRGHGGGGLVRRTVLPGGLRVVTEAMPAVRSVAFGIWVGVGSRDETPVARRRLALPRAPAVQGHQAPRRAGRSPRRSTRSAAR